MFLVLSERWPQIIDNPSTDNLLDDLLLIESLKGIVIPAEWDLQGNVIAVVIATGKEEDYLVEDHAAMSELKSFLRQEVEVSGVLGITNDEKKVIKIREIKKI